MKRFLTTLPLTLVMAGCGNSASQTTNANPAPTDTTTAQTSATSAGSDASGAASSTASSSTASSTTSDQTTTPDATSGAYRVVDESQDLDAAAAQMGIPASAVPAAKKALQNDALPPPPGNAKAPDKARVLMVTSKGPITLELNGKEAPLHVKSFLYLAGKGFYNGVRFHRYANLLEGAPGGGKGYIIQGGDPLTKSAKLKPFFGLGGPGYQIPREHNSLKHDKLVIAAARSSDPDSAGSQFYITQNPVAFLDEGDGYTVFGKVVGGQSNALKLRQDDVIKNVVVLKK